MILRVCALYPELMNIYADRGNLLMLERAAPGAHRVAVARQFARRGASRRARPLLHRCGQDSDQRRCASDMASSRRPRWRRGARALSSSASAAATAARALLRAWRGDDPGHRPARRAHRALERAATDRQRAVQSADGLIAASRTMPGAPSCSRARNRSAVWSRATATTAQAAWRERGGATSSNLRPWSAPAQERVAVRPPHRSCARLEAHELEPLEDSLEQAAHASALRAAGVA